MDVKYEDLKLLVRSLIKAYEDLMDALDAQGPSYCRDESDRLDKVLGILKKDHGIDTDLDVETARATGRTKYGSGVKFNDLDCEHEKYGWNEAFKESVIAAREATIKKVEKKFDFPGREAIEEFIRTGIPQKS